MFQSLARLKNNGYIPDMVLDIGAYKGTWTEDCLKIFPDAKYILFEPIKYDELNKFKCIENISVFNVLLNDENKNVNWYEMRNTGDSMFKELGHAFVNCEPQIRESNTIDSLSIDTSNSKNIFIKIDCQGAEIPILKGASTILNKVDFIILEMPFFGRYNENVPNFLEHIKFMDSIGFLPYDYIDSHIINQFTMQSDIMFIKKSHIFNKIIADIYK